ncbi:hypothetical protein RHAB21_03767 [Pseudorhizobium halotolerans]|uniref:Peptidase M48-like protein n=1 Tax=Pseudorhizobium halotolerans TaxID=1233081 RepID=A0ABM8PTA3_9HYPH|nr:hypothetical protein [Pseudorhizobium halotolerans]CAD7047330.1 hypothetical protein RHAB21_03767 [Pseudorhizobium halotolerans]
MTRASAGRIKRRQETDTLSWVATRVERARNSKRKLDPDKLARGMVTRAWKEALRRTHQCFGRSIDRFFRLEVSPEGSDLASIDLSSVPYQVNVSIGMPTFLYKITRLLAARSAPFSDGQVPGQHGRDVTVPYDESVLRMNRAFFWYSATRSSTVFQDFDIDEHQAVVAGMLAMEAEIFLICHELAHGLLADMPPGSDAFLKELQVGLGGLSADWREELSADRLALFLAIGKRPGPRDGHQLSMQYAGWEFSLLLHREWERYEETVTSASVSFTTHPPARDRVQDLRDTLRRYTGLPEASNAFSAAEAFATVFSGMVNSMFSEEFRQGAARRDELRANKLVALAHMCSAGAVPDYSRFVPEAMDLLQQAEGWTLLQHVCDATAPLRDEVAMDFKNLQVAKLIWRACEGLEEPLYSVFKRVTALPDLF